VGEHWEILLWALVLFAMRIPAQTHYVPANLWCDLVSRFQDAVSHPNTAASFRGSLVDEKQFAIDVKRVGSRDIMQDYRERRLRDLPATLDLQ